MIKSVYGDYWCLSEARFLSFKATEWLSKEVLNCLNSPSVPDFCVFSVWMSTQILSQLSLSLCFVLINSAKKSAEENCGYERFQSSTWTCRINLLPLWNHDSVHLSEYLCFDNDVITLRMFITIFLVLSKKNSFSALFALRNRIELNIQICPR